MKISYYINVKSSLIIMILIQLFDEFYVETMKTQMKFSALDMLDLTTNDKLTEQTAEAFENEIKIKSKEKLKVFEQKYNNFIKNLENVIVNLQFYRKFIEDAISGLKKIPAGSPNEKSLLDVIETNKVSLIKEKSKRILFVFFYKFFIK